MCESGKQKETEILTYSRRKRRQEDDIQQTLSIQESPPRPTPSQTESPPTCKSTPHSSIQIVDNDNLPIAIRKGIRRCT